MSNTSRSQSKQPLHRRTETFVVRVWTEYLEQMPPTWRGEIEHVGSKEVVHFGSLKEVSVWIHSCVAKQLQSSKQTEEQ